MSSTGSQSSTGRSRFGVLRKLLSAGSASTQEELRDALKEEGFDVTQSTISRDLRKLEAIKAIDARGRTVYRLSEDSAGAVGVTSSLKDHVMEIAHNGATIVIHTTPGSASLLARHLDKARPDGILGTIAGDDTIFVAPARLSAIKRTIVAIEESFGAA
jgi:transcriptional regulator of arginine metabolism